MGMCKWCQRKGFLLAVNKHGLCSICNQTIALDVEQRVRIIKESLEIAGKSRKLDTIVHRYDLALEHLGALLQYEHAGIEVISISVQGGLEDVRLERRSSIVKHAIGQVKDILAEAGASPSTASKISKASKALTKVSEATRHLDCDDGDEELERVKKDVEQFIHDTRLTQHLDNAHKAEFKGQMKKAVDQYQEALYLLRTDGTPDQQQTEMIASLENKIATLNGTSGSPLG